MNIKTRELRKRKLHQYENKGSDFSVFATGAANLPELFRSASDAEAEGTAGTAERQRGKEHPPKEVAQGPVANMSHYTMRVNQYLLRSIRTPEGISG